MSVVDWIIWMTGTGSVDDSRVYRGLLLDLLWTA